MPAGASMCGSLILTAGNGMGSTTVITRNCATAAGCARHDVSFRAHSLRCRPLGKHCRPRGAADVPRCRSTPGRLPHSRPVADVPALRPRAPGPRCCPPGRLSNRGRMRLETLTVGKVGLKGTSWRARAGGSSAACGRPAAVDGRRSGWRLAAGDPGSGPRPTNLLDARSNCCRGGRFKSV